MVLVTGQNCIFTCNRGCCSLMQRRSLCQDFLRCLCCCCAKVVAATLVGSVHPLRATPGSKHNSNVGTSGSSRHDEGTAKLVAHPRAENGCVVESKPLGSLQTILWPKVRVGNTNTLCAHTYILPNNEKQVH